MATVSMKYSAERKCDIRCTNAVGTICVCQCSGANHGLRRYGAGLAARHAIGNVGGQVVQHSGQNIPVNLGGTRTWNLPRLSLKMWLLLLFIILVAIQWMRAGLL